MSKALYGGAIGWLCLFSFTSATAQFTEPPQPDPPPGHNRGVLSIEITPGSAPGAFDLSAVVGFEARNTPDGKLDLSMTVFFLINGATVSSADHTVVLSVPTVCPDEGCDATTCGRVTLSAQAESIFCRESITCADAPYACACRCGDTLTVDGPAGQPLEPGDEITVILRPVPGTVPEAFTADDQRTVSVGRRGNGADFDGDNMLTLVDLREWVDCLSGPGIRPSLPECEEGDIDGSRTVDLADFAKVQLGFTGFVEMCSADSLRFRWPMPGVDARDWVINNYVDLDPTSGLLDYLGGAKTYNGHKGIDIDVPTFRSMDNDFPIVAAAAGYVVFTRDTEFDRNTSCTGTWNVVKIEHANGFKSIYGHLKQGSVTVSTGDYVVPGQKLGVVGSSGCSTHPHLHFEVHDCDDNVVPPFLNAMWLAPPVYDTPLGFMDAVLKENPITDVDQIKDPQPNVTLLSPGDSLGVGLSMAGGQAGDVTTVTLVRPDNNVFSTMTWNFGQVYRHSFWWNDRTLPTGDSALGFWKAHVRTNGALARTYMFGVSTVSPNAFQQVRHAIPESDYQMVFNNITAAGYRPVWIDGYEVNGIVFFNAIFDRSAVAGWSARHGMSGSAYQDWVDQIDAQGLRLVHVDSYPDDGNIRYAAIAAGDGGPPWTAYHGRTVADHQGLFNTLTGQGFRAVNISVVQIGGTTRVTALYDKKPVGSWVALAGLTSSAYQQEFNNQTNAGRTLSYLDGYTENGVAKFSAIWDSTQYDSWVARHDQSFQQFQDEFDLWAGQGYLTRIVTGYENGGVANFGGFWTHD